MADQPFRQLSKGRRGFLRPPEREALGLTQDYFRGRTVRLLIVEDDVEIAEGLVSALRRSGHAVDCVARGADALSALETEQYALVVLDLGLPDVDGLDVLKALRARPSHTPVLILTARDSLRSRVGGLDVGADDYVLKPFDYEELEARIRAVTRRTMSGSGADVQLGNLTLKSAERRFYVNDTPVELSPREFGVLEILLLRHDHVVSKSQVESHVCDWSEELTEGAIELYIHRVRRKIEGAAVEIRTVRGFGYLLQQPRPG